MSLASKITNAPRDMLPCIVVAMTSAGERKVLKVYCKAFYEIYGKLRKQGLRLVSYTVTYSE